MESDTKLGPEALAELERAPAMLNGSCECPNLEEMCARCAMLGMLADHLPALIAAARRLGEVEAELAQLRIVISLAGEPKEGA